MFDEKLASEFGACFTVLVARFQIAPAGRIENRVTPNSAGGRGNRPDVGLDAIPDKPL
jgi:hypothetical protein